DLRTILSITLKKAFRGSTTCNITSPDRHYFTRVTFTPIIDVQLNITGAVALFHDITEMQNLLEQLELEKERAEEANRLKSEFLANMSHELRTPLNSIIGYTHCVLDELDGPVNEEQTKDLNRVVTSAENLLHLINDILDLSKIESGKMELFPEKTEAAALIREVIIAVNPVAEQKKLVLAEKVEPDLPYLYADSFRIRQVLMNLIGNAVKFTSEGGVTAGAYFEPLENAVVFYVRDTGIGLSEESIQYIFEEFRQADGSTTRRFGGSGLGLSISRRLVEMLGGSIWVESKIGEGSCFFFTVPLLDVPQTQEQPVEVTPVSKKENNVVIVIDDDNEDIKLITQFLEPEGYKVIGANSGREGIQLIKEQKPMAVLLDVLMPELDGWQTLYNIKADDELQNIPIIMASVIENRELGFALGAAEYLAKPVRKPDLLRKISMFRSVMVNETILVVDDDPNFCDLAQKILSAEYRVLTASSGEEALELLNVYMPDLILVDLMMPGMDGFQFIFHVRSNYSRNLPLIVISAKDITEQERNYLHELFVDNIIRKGAMQKEEFIKYLSETLVFFETLSNKGEMK
ncbi:MAG: response regulator, partial [Candidatus Saccharibacteria bacterium]